MWKYIVGNNCWSITKTSGFIVLTFDLWKPIKESNYYRLSINKLDNVYQDIFANNFDDAKLIANELIHDSLRWNN